jgi:glycosyltransferase involved in cell wall biosynthesis
MNNRQILWWGRSDPLYSRNHVMRKQLLASGWEITDFRPHFCMFGALEARLRKFAKPAAVWVPCFRQRDVLAARHWCDYQKVPLIFDPLISAYDKQVWERFKYRDTSRAAQHLLRWERKLFAKADFVIADTPCHAAYFTQTLGVPASKIFTVYVGADEEMFAPGPDHVLSEPLDVLFYGSFLPLHGTETIIEAARIYEGPPVRWSLLGDGPAKSACQVAAVNLKNVFFEDKRPYRELPSRIHQADILLGVFGTTQKAGRVIPNKVFQALAAGRPVITRGSPAYPAPVCVSQQALELIPPGDAKALASAVAAWAAAPSMLAERGRSANKLYSTNFSTAVIRAQLSVVMDKISNQ